MTTPSSDEKLRDLERTFRQTGSPDDEAAWLLERVRIGELTPERLELAAYCGHEAARRAIQTSHGAASIKDLATYASRCGRPACVYAMLVACRLLIEQLPDQSDARELLVIAEEWLEQGGKVQPKRSLAAWHSEGVEAIYPFVAAYRLLTVPEDLMEEWLSEGLASAATATPTVVHGLSRTLAEWSLRVVSK
jgi:hypothetical protein